jgi:drug/metabolite transporter (DMT)-like permease
MLETYGYALLSAILWAVSAPVITSGLKQIPSEEKIPGILLGLLISLVSGSTCLFLFTLPLLNEIALSPPLFAAGVFTFPIATALYYLCGYAFDGKAEIASQFSRVKPLFSVVLATLILGEPLISFSGVSFGFIVLGISLLLYETIHSKFQINALILGFLTALSWAIGDIFIKLGVRDTIAIADTFVSLSSATVVFALIAIPYLAKRIPSLIGRWMYCFVFHGVVSFGIAYACYYESIRQIGVSKTVLITAFWPALAIVAAIIRSWFKGENYQLSRLTWIAVLCLLVGSLVQAITF